MSIVGGILGVKPSDAVWARKTIDNASKPKK